MVVYVRKEKLGNISYLNSFVELSLPSNLGSNDFIKITNYPCKALLSAPLTITINITDKCNFSCGFCYFKKGKTTLTYKQIDLLIKYIKDKCIYEVDILGGEPLFPKVAKKTTYLINKLLKIASVKRVYLSTNGSFLNESLYKLLSNKKIELSISLEGIKRDHELLTKSTSFGKVKRNILNLDNKTEIKYTITTVINKLNRENLNLFYGSFLVKLNNLKCWLWHYPTIVAYNKNFSDNVMGLKKFYNLVETFRKKTPDLLIVDAPYNYLFSNSNVPTSKLEKVLCMCKGKYKKIEIMPDGEAYPCALLRFEKYNLGSIDKGFKYSPNKISLRNSCSNNGCKYWNVCYGCLGYKLANGDDPRCPEYK